ncbi:mediator of replication checkpoint protein 1, partial [Tremellales sp. Uapishka_1]
MSSSSLSPAPSSMPAPSTTAVQTPVSPTPLLKAPRRTYGRARISSPPPPTFSPAAPTVSPAKGLLNGFTHRSSSWRDSLSKLDVNIVQPDDEEADVKKAMERMRKEARGEVITSDPPLPASSSPKHKMAVPTTQLGISFSSDSLSSAPHISSSLPRPTSPPSEDVEEETYAIRKSGRPGPSGRRKVVQSSDDEDEEDGDRTIQRLGSSPLLRDTPTLKSRARASSVATLEDDGSPAIDNPVDEYLKALREEAEAVEDAETSSSVSKGKQRQRSASIEADGLFEDEIKEDKKNKGRKLKGLNKKDKEEMNKDIARARREKNFAYSRPKPDMLPMSSYLPKASEAVKLSRPPPLVHGGSSPATSPSKTTPVDADPISNFTPSSVEYLKPLGQAPTKLPGKAVSSPTPHPRGKTLVPATSTVMPDDEDEEDALPDLSSLLEEDRRAELRAEEEKRMYQKLQQRKSEAIKLQKQAAKPAGPLEDDDFEIYTDETITEPKPQLRFFAKPSTSRFPDAKAVLSKSAGSAISKNRQALLSRAGVAAREKAELEGRLMVRAGKHSFGKVGSKKAERTEKVVEKDQLDNLMRRNHLEQARALRLKKEMDFGGRRNLPEKKEIVVDIPEQLDHAEDATSGDEEEEDEDFAPAPEDESDDEVEYSGEEGDGEEENQAEEEDEEGHDKENQPPPRAADEDFDDEEDGDVPLRKRRNHISSARTRIVDSDDETDLPTLAPSAPFVMMRGSATPELDLAGFGGDGSPGFSQLFGETQAVASDGDGFAGLRALQPVGLLPSHLALPRVNISETQAERDNELIAAEAEAELELDVPAEPVSKKQYLNTQGFFTQTKPQLIEPTQLSDDEYGANSDKLQPWSSLSNGPAVLSSTQKNPPSAEGEYPKTSSPSQALDEQTFTRLKRRTTPQRMSDDVDMTTSSPSPSKRRDAFSLLMAPKERPQAESISGKRSGFVDEQAEESDEDNGWAPIGGKEDEEDDEDQDGYVEGLVDDEAVDEEERERQDALVAEKAREIQLADDAKREEEARKITEGNARTKRRGADWMAGDLTDDEDAPRRLSKKQRRKRDLGKEDGLDKLPGEANVFYDTYHQGLDLEDSDTEDVPLSPARDRSMEPSPVKRAAGDKQRMLRDMARLNTEKKNQAIEIGGDDRERSFMGDWEIDNVDEPEELESQFSVIKSMRPIGTENEHDYRSGAPLRKTSSFLRPTESYQAFVQEESQANRRLNGAGAGGSVVFNQPSRQSSVSSNGGKSLHRPPARQQSTSSSAGSILLPKTNKFTSS